MLWLLILHAFLGIPSLAFYIFLLVFLEKKSHVFSGNYYTLLKYGGVVEILTYVLNFGLLNLMSFPELCSMYLWLGQLPWFQYTLWIPPATFHIFSLNVILISIHRLFILKNPLEGDEKFRPFVRPAHVLIPIVSFVLTGYIPWQHPKIVEVIKGKEIVAEWYMDEGIDFFRITVISAAFYAIVIAALSIASFFLMHNHKNIAKTMRKLLAISLIINVIQIGFAFIMTFKVVAYYTEGGLDRFLDYYVIPFNIVAACLATPWIHFCCNKTVRDQIMKSFGR